ncbi:profilin-3-like [Haliotis rubra]|uniref:profilin-3-like n=1 Tax=Haliotis rubra TaxID=36100 RepID=UPI001EE54AEA|nr:profilin-3-like [Haliotis rubra]
MVKLRKGVAALQMTSENRDIDSPSVTWNDYVDVFMNGGFASKISIHSIVDGKVWAASPNALFHPVEVKDIIDGFDDSSKLHLQGICLGGRVFTLTRVTGASIMVGRDARTAAGCVIFKANTCVLIAMYEEGTHPGSCYSTMVKIGDYLLDKGF